MAKLNREKLAALRREMRESLDVEAGSGAVHIIVGMGTSAIAAGSRDTYEAFEKACADHSLSNVVLRQAGSLGLDHAEPTAEIRMDGMPTVIYGRVTPEIADKIVRKHVVGKALINDHVFDRPAADIIDTKERT